MKPELAAEYFQIDEEILEIQEFGKGNIHKTCQVITRQGPGYILQRLNTRVFPDPVGLIDNHYRITHYLQEQKGKGDIDWEIPVLIPLQSGGYLLEFQGEYWRMLKYIPHVAFTAGNTSAVYEKAGQAYGTFGRVLSGFPSPPLYETIPGFHNLSFRLEQFDIAREAGNKKRIFETMSEIDLINQFREEALFIPDLWTQNKIPVRITHNDTKVDNILFNRQGEVVSVIDLDTVMPGILHSDYGDALRTFGNRVREDEKDTGKVGINKEAVTFFTKGYISSLRDVLTDIEVETLSGAPALFAFMQAVRFLSDYLQDDEYYRISYPDHNRIRTGNQIALFMAFREYEKQLKKTIASFL